MIKKIIKKNGCKIEDFNKRQRKQIREGLMAGLDVSFYAKPEFNCEQMREIKEWLIEEKNNK